MSKFEIKVGDYVAFYSRFSSRPTKRQVVRVTPAGKFQVEWCDALFTPRETVSRLWVARVTGGAHQGTCCYPWTQDNDAEVAREEVRKHNRIKLSKIKLAIDELGVSDGAAIDRVLEALGIQYR